jgi:1-acylglycerone phosphate reductase
MPNEAYAASVAKQILKPQPPKWFWQGNRAWLIWFLDRFFFRSVWVSGI